MSATATCIAIVDLPEPPFSLPQTITWALRRRALPSEVPPTFANNMSPTPRPRSDHAGIYAKFQRLRAGSAGNQQGPQIRAACWQAVDESTAGLTQAALKRAI